MPIKKQHIYKSTFLNKTDLTEVEPFYIVHKAINKTHAKQDAIYYFRRYWVMDKNLHFTNFEALKKSTLIQIKRLKKL